MIPKKNSNLIAISVIVIGVLLSSWSGWLLYEEEEKAIINEFRGEVDDLAASIFREVAVNFEALRSLAIMFDGETVPNSNKFGLEAQKILIRHSDIQALEWIPRVMNSERAAYVSTRREDFPEFEITERQEQGHMVTAENRQVYFPVYYVEPLIGNETAFGFDLASSPTRLVTLEMSRDTGEPQATASITLVQEREDQQGFLAFLPIYEGFPTTVEKRRDNLSGFVLGVYRIGDIFQSSVHNNELSGIEIMLVDETAALSQDILYVQDSPTGSPAGMSHTYAKELPDIWGRKWSLIASPASSYISVRRNFLPLATFTSGVVFTLFIALYIRVISRRALTIQKVVVERTNELNEANRKLEMLSRTDALTGVANRRYMDDYLDQEWLRAIRSNSSISFILIDIDYFKLYNDNYGHQMGDECLKKVAERLETVARRPGDLVVRYGGEELALVLTDTENAESVANDCRRSIEELGISHELSKISDVVTISVGYCTVAPKKGTDPSWVIESADKALYKAKKAGRNKVELCVPPS